MYSFGVKKKRKKDRRSQYFGSDSLDLPIRGGRARTSQSFGSGTRYSLSHVLPPRTIQFHPHTRWQTLPSFIYPEDNKRYYRVGEYGWWRLEDGKAVMLDSRVDQVGRFIRHFVNELPPEIRAQIDTPVMLGAFDKGIGKTIVGGADPDQNDAMLRHLRSTYGSAENFLRDLGAGRPVEDLVNEAQVVGPSHYEVTRQYFPDFQAVLERERSEKETRFDTFLDSRPLYDPKKSGRLTDIRSALLDSDKRLSELDYGNILTLSYEVPTGEFIPFPWGMKGEEMFTHISAYLANRVYEAFPSHSRDPIHVHINDDFDMLLDYVMPIREDVHHFQLQNLYNRHVVDFIVARGTHNVADVLTDASLVAGFDSRFETNSYIADYVSRLGHIRKSSHPDAHNLVATGHSLGAYTVESLPNHAVDFGVSFAPYFGRMTHRHDKFIRFRNEHDVFANKHRGEYLIETEGKLGYLEAHSMKLMRDHISREYMKPGGISLGPVDLDRFVPTVTSLSATPEQKISLTKTRRILPYSEREETFQNLERTRSRTKAALDAAIRPALNGLPDSPSYSESSDGVFLTPTKGLSREDLENIEKSRFKPAIRKSKIPTRVVSLPEVPRKAIITSPTVPYDKVRPAWAVEALKQIEARKAAREAAQSARGLRGSSSVSSSTQFTGSVSSDGRPQTVAEIASFPP